MGADRRITVAGGVLVLRGAPEAERALTELVNTHEPRPLTGLVELGGARVFVKASPLTGRTSRRYALRRLLGLLLPRVQEYENLRWLAARVFQVPRPFAAGILWRGGLPRYQVLIVEEVQGAQELDAALADTGEAGRRALATELGAEVARMHALGFVHRDLFARNLLVLPPSADRRLVFVDGWRAAPHASLRGPAYDLACLFLEGMDLWSAGEQQLLLDTYAQARADHGRAAGDLLPKTRRERDALLRRMEREPGRLRGQERPGPWNEDLRWPCPG